MTLSRCALLLIIAGLLAVGACVESPADKEQAAVPPAATPPLQPEPAASRWTGDAINFTFTTADGSQVAADSYAGKPLVLNFWAAW